MALSFRTLLASLIGGTRGLGPKPYTTRVFNSLSRSKAVCLNQAQDRPSSRAKPRFKHIEAAPKMASRTRILSISALQLAAERV